MLSTRNVLKNKSNIKMSAKTEIDTKMIESKCSMNLRKKVLLKASEKENKNIGSNSKKVALIKNAIKDDKFSKEPSNIKKSVLADNNNQKSSSSQPSNQLESFEKSALKTNFNDNMEKQIPTLKRPKRGLKTKDSVNECVSHETEPCIKSLKRKRGNQENSETVMNVKKHRKGKNFNKAPVSLTNMEQEKKETKSIEINNAHSKGSDSVNSCCLENNAPIKNLESIKSLSKLETIEADSNLVSKPNTRSAKRGVTRRELKGDSKTVVLDASKLHNLQKENNVVLQASKMCENSSKLKSGKHIKDGSSKKKVPAKTLKKRKITDSKCESDGKITNYFNVEVLSETKSSRSKAPSATVQNSDHIPIYRKVNEKGEAKKVKKYSRVSDVYNIDYDEDMKNSPIVLKKKPKKATKKKPKNSKSKVGASKSQAVKKLKKCNTGTTSNCINAQGQNNSTSPHHNNEDDMDVDSVVPDFTHFADEPPMLSKDSDEPETASSLTCVTGKEKEKNPASRTPEKQKDVQKIMTKEAQFVVGTSSPVPNERQQTSVSSETPDQDSIKNIDEDPMMTLLSDFEASFLKPHLTSTPDHTDPKLPVKRPVISKKHRAVRRLEITRIPPIKSVQEPHIVSDIDFESPEKIDLSGIVLFESPPKNEEDKTQESRQKKIGKKCRTKLNFGKSSKTAQKNEKISSFFTSTHCNPETDQLSGDNPLSKSPKRVLREKKKVVPEEIELSEDESDFEDDLFCTYSDNEDERGGKKDIVSNSLSSSPVKFLEIMKPRKSYSPSVKPCFSRTKKAATPVKPYVSQEEKLIQSMNEHFSELDSMELCIE